MKMTLLVAALLAASVCGTVGLYYNIQSSSDQTAANVTSSVDGAAADRADGTPKTSPATTTVDESYGGAPPEYASSSDLLTESMSMSAGGGMGGAGGMGPGDATPSSSARMGMEMGGAPGGAAGPTSDAVGGDGRPMEETPGMPAPGEPDGRTPRSGQLTAGTIDDVAGWREFQEFLQDTLQNDPSESYPRMVIGQPFMIQVLDGKRHPIRDARVVLSSEGKTLVDRRTGSDGRLLVTSGGDRVPEKFTVTVSAQNQKVTEQCNRADLLCNIIMADCEGAAPAKLDLALVIDTTGSMGDELAYLKSEIQAIAATVSEMFPNVDQRFALIVYRDNGDQYVTRSLDFTGSLDKFRREIGLQVASGGGDYPEAMHVAMEQAAQLDWREDAARMVFLVGDAPPHDEHAERTMESGRQLRQRGVRIFPVGASGVAKKAEFIMRSLAFMTQGQYLFLTDHSGIGNSHEAPHVSEYIVEHLDRAMIRMIASELTGKRLAPTEVLAIESGKWQPQWEEEDLQFGEVSQTSWQQPLAPIYGCCIVEPTKPRWWQRSWETAKENAIWVLIANAGIGVGAVFFFLQQRHLNVKS